MDGVVSDCRCFVRKALALFVSRDCFFDSTLRAARISIAFTEAGGSSIVWRNVRAVITAISGTVIRRRVVSFDLAKRRTSSSNLLCCRQICSWIDRNGAITLRN